MSAVPVPAEEWRASLAAGRRSLREGYLRKPSPAQLLRGHTRLIDHTLRGLWKAIDPAPAERERLERLIGMLWDIGLDVGHSVRTVRGCVETAAEDVTIQTTLLEARHLAGSRALFRKLTAAVGRALDAPGFLKAKVLEQEQRHAKHQDAVYALEPNLKEAPGGLRDLQTIQWIARACGLGWRWRELQRRGLLLRAEAVQLARH